ncbi:MAG: hypothetical protein IBJ19_02725 [Gemmatimonadaceae bacterium]|nr:hypothetical protein [Gemmatimonadaceae bacterium]
MSTWTERVVRMLCEPAWHEEILGDLEELRGQRGVSSTRHVVSVVLRCRRRRRQGAGMFAVATVFLVALLINRVQASRAPLTISASDAAGAFTLEFAGHRVVAATVDGVALSADRIAQDDDRIWLRGANHGEDLVIHVPARGSIAWSGRSP